MGAEERRNKAATLSLVRSVGTHDGDMVHGFNHTDGKCPKCGCPQHAMFFCNPGGARETRIPGCEVLGEHLHRMCGACHYPWVERCMDQAIAALERGEVTADSDGAATLAALCEKLGGIVIPEKEINAHRGWLLHFERDGTSGVVTLSSVAPPEPGGKPAALTPEMIAGNRPDGRGA